MGTLCTPNFKTLYWPKNKNEMTVSHPVPETAPLLSKERERPYSRLGQLGSPKKGIRIHGDPQ